MKIPVSRLLFPVLRTVESGKPIPATWRQPLVRLATLMTLHRDERVSVRAVQTLVAMEAANLRNGGDFYALD